jgi:protoheme IX farnesyltransferase
MRDYYQLTKPGIIYGNLLTAVAGFMLASRGHIHLLLLLAMATGLAAIIGAACVYNNVIDRDIDKQMARTKTRALPAGRISVRQALIFASGLLVLGVVLLAFGTNLLTLGVALFGAFAYLVLYGFGKRKTVHGTLIGSISGAVPPVVGYLAVSEHFDVAAGLLFIILVSWQMPHFYAIALFRARDYAAAGVPVLPVVAGAAATKKQVLVYIVAFAIASSLLTFQGYTGYLYLGAIVLVSLGWILRGLTTYSKVDDAQWGRLMFKYSLLVLLLWSLLLSVDRWLF